LSSVFLKKIKNYLSPKISSPIKDCWEAFCYFSQGMNALEIRNLTLRIGEKCVLDHFSLPIPTGEIHVLMGKNCRGKVLLPK
jgi:hypothetical protein